MKISRMKMLSYQRSQGFNTLNIRYYKEIFGRFFLRRFLKNEKISQFIGLKNADMTLFTTL